MNAPPRSRPRRLRPSSLRTPTPLVGVQELGFSLLTVVSIALGL